MDGDDAQIYFAFPSPSPKPRRPGADKRHIDTAPLRLNPRKGGRARNEANGWSKRIA